MRGRFYIVKNQERKVIMAKNIRIDLAGKWQLSADGVGPLSAELPGDNYSALLDAGLIPDPYIGCNEREVNVRLNIDILLHLILL